MLKSNILGRGNSDFLYQKDCIISRHRFQLENFISFGQQEWNGCKRLLVMLCCYNFQREAPKQIRKERNMCQSAPAPKKHILFHNLKRLN